MQYNEIPYHSTALTIQRCLFAKALFSYSSYLNIANLVLRSFKFLRLQKYIVIQYSYHVYARDNRTIDKKSI